MFENIGMKQLLPKLTERLKDFKLQAAAIPVPLFRCEAQKPEDSTITQSWFWPRLASFFKPNDVIITETGKPSPSVQTSLPNKSRGTANFGILDVPLPKGSMLLNQVLWGSIGWSVGKLFLNNDVTSLPNNCSGSTLGAALAARERKLGRTILFVGDGSL